MRIYVQDRAGNTLDVIDKIYDDKHAMILASGVSTYDFTTVVAGDNVANLKEGNIVILTDRTGRGWAFTIMTVDRTNIEITCHCEDLGLELLNKNRDAWTSPGSAQPLTYYFDQAVAGTGWEIGINEASNLTRTLSWDGRTTALARLLSIATEFDNAELEFRVEFRNLTITKKIVNVYKHRGMDRNDVQLIYGDRVSDIKQTSDLTNFHTALQGVGSQIQEDGQDANSPVKYVDFSGIKYDDGDYYSPQGDPMVYARTANRQFNITDTYLEDFYEYDTSSPQELFNRTLTQLKKQSEVALNYDISLTEIDPALDLGDTVTIIDRDFNPALYLSARMLEIDRSYSDPTKDTATFGNFLILQDNISAQLRDLQDKMSKMKPGQTPHAWVRYADDDKGTNMSDLAAGKAYMAIVWNYETAVPSDDPADYTGHWVKIQGDPGQAGKDGANGQPGPAGSDGKTSYFHVAWADSADGKTDFSTDDAGERAYIGTYSDFTAADSTSPADYTWQLNKGAKGDTGAQGPATFVVSATAPTNPIKGFVWMQTDANGNLANAQKWDGTQWVDASISGSLIVDVLTGKIINGGEFHTSNTWDDPNRPGKQITNTQDITKDGYRMVTDRYESGTDELRILSEIDNNGLVKLGYGLKKNIDLNNNPWGGVIASMILDPVNQNIVFQAADLGDYYLNIQDAYQNDMAPSSFTYFNGYGPSSDNASDPNNGHLFRFGRTVVLNTYFKRKSGTNNGAYTDFFQLPAWARPAQTAFVYLVLAQGFATYAGQGYVYNTGKVHSGAIGGGVGKDGGEYQVFGVWQGVDITS